MMKLLMVKNYQTKDNVIIEAGTYINYIDTETYSIYYVNASDYILISYNNKNYYVPKQYTKQVYQPLPDNVILHTLHKCIVHTSNNTRLMLPYNTPLLLIGESLDGNSYHVLYNNHIQNKYIRLVIKKHDTEYMPNLLTLRTFNSFNYKLS